LSPFFEHFFILGGPRGFREKNIQKIDSIIISSDVKIKVYSAALFFVSTTPEIQQYLNAMMEYLKGVLVDD
jgi:hypothetical protein